MITCTILFLYCFASYLIFLFAIRNKIGEASPESFSGRGEIIVVFLLSPILVWVLLEDIINYVTDILDCVGDSRIVKWLFNIKE